MNLNPFKNLMERIKDNDARARAVADDRQEIRDESAKAYAEEFKRAKIEESRTKAREDATKKPFDKFAKWKSMILPPYTPEQLEALAGKPIVTKETEWMYAKKTEEKKE